MKKKHIIGVHEGHDVLYEGATQGQLEDDCCGGVLLFTFCPKCGKQLPKIKHYDRNNDSI